VRCRLREILVKGAMVAQPGQRVGDRDLRHPLVLGEVRGAKSPADIGDDYPQGEQERDARAERDHDRLGRGRVVAAKRVDRTE
jgi:hypothetical protein